jgi:predicted Zn-dependent peptidase
MRRWATCAIALAAWLCVAVHARPARAQVETYSPPTRVVLKNGLSVVVVEDHHAPLVSLELRYSVGTADEPPARPGIAYLTQRLMVQRTAHLSDGQYQRELDAVGAVTSGWTTKLDSTGFHATVPSEAIAVPLWLWSDGMGFFGPNLDDALVRTQAKGAQSLRAQALENAALGRLGEIVMGVLYPPGHPYRGGSFRTDALLDVTADDVRAFARGRYVPGRAALVLVGDLKTDRALALVNQYFGSLPGANIPPAVSAPTPFLKDETILHVAANVDAPSIAIVWPTPAWYAPGDAALDLVAEQLAGERTQRLRASLIDASKIASGVAVRQTSHALGSELWIQATASRGHTAAELKKAIDQVLNEIRERGPPAQESRVARTTFLLGKAFSRAPLSGRADLYMESTIHPMADPYLEAYLSRFLQLDARAMQDAVVTYLPTGRRIVVEIEPDRSAPIAGVLRQAPRAP